jgi:hypothetical protein
MAKLKKTPKQQMKYWRVRGLTIKARTARVAIRKYIRHNLTRDVITREFELDNPFGGGKTYEEVVRDKDKSFRYCVELAKSEEKHIKAVRVNKNGHPI